MTVALAAAALLLTSGSTHAQFEASAGAGAGYESNVDLAPSGSSLGAFGSTTLSAWGDAGWAFQLSPFTRLYAGARYDGILCLDAPDLSRHVPGAEATLAYEWTDWLALVVSPSAAYALYGDSARDAVKLGVRGLVRVRPWPWLSLRAGYARAQSWASDPIFSLGVDRLLVSAEAKLAPRSYLAAGYSLSLGDQVFYRQVTSDGVGTGFPGRASGHRGSGGFATLVPYQAAATEHTWSVRWEQGLWAQLYLTASYDHTRGSSTEGNYVVHSVFAATGYRF